MIKWQDTVLVSGGGALAGASVYVYLHGTTTLATIYSDNGVTTQTNPLTTSATGFYSFYAADGRYDLSIQKTGYTTVTITDISVDDAADASAINATTLTATTGTINTLNSTNGTVTTLNSTTGTIATLNATNATLTNATIPTLNSTTGTVTTLNATTSTINTGNFSTKINVNGRVEIQTSANNGGLVEIGGNATVVSGAGYGVSQYQTIPSSASSQYWCFTTVPSTAASVFTLNDFRHYNSAQGTIGAGSSITNQYGFYATAGMTGAANNYGFFGAIPSGSNRWNLYMSGTALNYVAGRFLFGTLTDDATNQVQVAGNIAAVTAGSGFRIKEGSNAKMGTATLVAGSVVVSNTSVTANSRILLTSNADGGTPGWLRVSARTASTSFTITSSSGTDTSTVAYLIMEPA